MEENGTQAVLIGCCLIVTNIVLAAFGGVITLLVIVTTTGITLFTADEPGTPASAHKLHATTGLMAECLSLVLVFIISATINWLLCISLLNDRQAARKYALSVSLLPTMMAGIVGVLILSHYAL